MHRKHSSMNMTRDRSGLRDIDRDPEAANTNSFNPFVSVTVFEQTVSTDVIYNSDGSPSWNHYLLFIVPFSEIDEYIWLKQHAGDSSTDKLLDNPVFGIKQPSVNTPSFPKRGQSRQSPSNPSSKFTERITEKLAVIGKNGRYSRPDSFSVTADSVQHEILSPTAHEADNGAPAHVHVQIHSPADTSQPPPVSPGRIMSLTPGKLAREVLITSLNYQSQHLCKYMNSESTFDAYRETKLYRKRKPRRISHIFQSCTTTDTFT